MIYVLLTAAMLVAAAIGASIMHASRNGDSVWIGILCFWLAVSIIMSCSIAYRITELRGVDQRRSSPVWFVYAPHLYLSR